MKKNVVIIMLVLFLFSCVLLTANASFTGDEPPKAGEPLLITNAGQGPGGKMARLLIIQSQAVKDWTYNAEPQPEVLEEKPYKTLLVVIGSSAKGLGASGITIDDEIERLDKMIEKAKELEMQIIAAHIEGMARRDQEGGANERSINAIAPFADHIIVREDSNDDGKFTKIAEENEIPITFIKDTRDLTEVIKAMYANSEEEICD